MEGFPWARRVGPRRALTPRPPSKKTVSVASLQVRAQPKVKQREGGSES